MTDSDINSLLFRGVISNLANLRSPYGSRLNESNESEPVSFSIGYQPRPVERFAHNYERDKFLHNRDKFILLHHEGRSFVIVKLERSERVTIFKRPLHYVFGNDSDRVISILEKLVHKFYDDVSVDDVLQFGEVDLSNGNSSNRHRVVYEL